MNQIKPKQRRKTAPVAIVQPHGSVPAPITSSAATAMQALAAGVANEGQQKQALRWILEGACAQHTWAYRESPRETDIALGRHFVAQQIVGLIKVNVSQLRKIEGREEIEHG